MQTFKQYFQTLLKERYSLNHLYKMTSELIQNFKEQISTLDDHDDPGEIYLDFDDDNTIIIKLYQETPPAYTGNSAIYFSDSSTIALFLDNIVPNKKYTIRKLKNKIPLELEQALRHEINHAYDDIIKNIDGKRKSIDITNISPDDPQFHSKYKEYVNTDEEIYSTLQEYIPSIVERNKTAKKLFDTKQLNKLTNYIAKLMMKLDRVELYTQKNKKRFYKLLYGFLDHMTSDIQQDQ